MCIRSDKKLGIIITNFSIFLINIALKIYIVEKAVNAITNSYPGILFFPGMTSGGPDRIISVFVASGASDVASVDVRGYHIGRIESHIG